MQCSEDILKADGCRSPTYQSQCIEVLLGCCWGAVRADRCLSAAGLLAVTQAGQSAHFICELTDPGSVGLCQHLA